MLRRIENDIIKEEKIQEGRMNKYKKMEKEDWMRRSRCIVLVIGVITIGGIFLLPAYFYIWLILTFGSIFLFIRWDVKNFAYRCSKCGYEFEISIFTYFITPHGPGWKYLKCPKCQKRSRANLIKKVEEKKRTE